MKVLLLSRYARLGASTRLRSLQYLPSLERQGIQVEVAPLFEDLDLERLYRGRRSGVWRHLARYGARVRQALRRRGYDAVWLEKEALPWVPWALEGMLLRGGPPLLTDYDDALFHRYDASGSGVIRRLLGTKIDRVMARSDVVTAGNDYLAERARSAGGARVEILPTVIDLDRYPAPAPPTEPPVVGWIGSPATQKYLAPIAAALRDLPPGTTLRLIGASAAPEGVSSELVRWKEESEVQALSALTVGIMPLPDSPWERGKCGYKLIQYMACGRAVVASPVGVNQQLVVPGVTGYLAETAEEWRDHLRRLIVSPHEAAKMGAEGRKLVESRYCLAVTAPRLAELFRSLA